MIHIMSDLKETTEAVRRSEQELREAKAYRAGGEINTLGELTTGIAHELNNPLNNIGLLWSSAIDLIELGTIDGDSERILRVT